MITRQMNTLPPMNTHTNEYLHQWLPAQMNTRTPMNTHTNEYLHQSKCLQRLFDE